jgi:hypothetical protein
MLKALYNKNTWDIARPERDHARTADARGNKVSAIDMGHLTPLWILTAVLVVFSLILFLIELFNGKKSAANKIEALH